MGCDDKSTVIVQRRRIIHRIVPQALIAGGREVFQWPYRGPRNRCEPGFFWRPHLEMYTFKLDDASTPALSGLIVGYIPNEADTPTTFTALRDSSLLIPLEFETTPTVNAVIFEEDVEEGRFPVDDQQAYKLVMSWGAHATESGTFTHQVGYRQAAVKNACR